MSKNNAVLIRQHLLAERRKIPVSCQREQSQDICRLLQEWFSNQLPVRPHMRLPGNFVVAAFWPLGDEPDLVPLLRYLNQAGITTALPVVAKKNAPLEFHRWVPDTPLKAGAFGVMEPPPDVALRPNLLLVPTLGFTSTGDRIGYGGGYYDRSLAALCGTGTRPLTIGIAWREGFLGNNYPDYQACAHDMPLDTILTADGWHTRMPTLSV